MDASFFADVFSKLTALSKRWSAEQTKSESLFAALLEFHGRLLTLTADSPLPPSLDHLEDAAPLLRARHVHGLENILAALRKSTDKFTALRAEISEVHTSVWQRHAAVISADGTTPEAAAAALAEPTSGVVGAGRGRDAQTVGRPPPMLCIDWVRELDGMYASELLLKLELLDGIDLGLGSEVLQGVSRLWTLQPHLGTAAIERVASLAASLNLPQEGIS